MNDNDLSRRQFQKLAMVALGGLVAGAGLAHADDKKDDKKEDKPKDEKKEPLLQENDCAGTSACATATAHTCGGENACRGLGGCGETPGENKCKGMGKCHVPLTDKAWEKARKRYEAVMKKADKKFGEAPKKTEK
jgi:hypothetical protein